MVAAPWRLVSPSGVIHVVRDDDELKALAVAEPEVVVHRKNILKKLVDPQNTKDLLELPMHQKHWQLLERVVWLERTDTKV